MDMIRSRLIRTSSAPNTHSSASEAPASMTYTPPTFPDSFIVPPKSGTHTSTWIVLHGRGDQGRQFAQGWTGFLDIRLPPNEEQGLSDLLPDTKFIFPNAPKRAAGRFDGMIIPQWFDLYSWDDSEKFPEWQVNGLKETAEYVAELVRKEIKLVGKGNVVVGGLSQGCASMLICLLTWEEELLGGIKAAFGMSGWLPFRHVLEKATEDSHMDGASGGSVDLIPTDTAAFDRAAKALRKELGLDVSGSNVARNVPLFIAHGGADDKVDVQLGREAASTMKKLGCDVSYKEYDSLVHWMRRDEIEDVLKFVNNEGVLPCF